MRAELRRRVWGLAVAAAAIAATAACAHGAGGGTAEPPRGAGAVSSQTQGGRRTPRLDHLLPGRDSMGSMPSRFEWTAVPGADTYSVGIWNEVDMLIWRLDGIPTNSLATPDSLRLEPGTYFWTISALQQGEEIAASGLSAFVVRPSTP